MAIRIDVQELQTVLRLTPPEQNIMLIGKHGIGKSEIITHFYRKKGMKVVAFFLGQMSDPGDLIGLMHKDEVTGRSLFLPPYWWPENDEPIVLFLDELNRARPEILQAVQDLTLNKTLAGKRLPQNSIVISAVNEGDEYQLTDLDPALVSRFNLYEFAPTVEDWLLWANANEIDHRIITFIQKNGHYLDGEGAATEDLGFNAGLIKTPDRRAWVKVSHFIKDFDVLDELQTKIIAGIVGTTAAMAFRQSLAAIAKVTAAQILRYFSRHKDKLKDLPMQDLILLNEQIVFWINGQRYKKDEVGKVRQNLLAYMKHLKQEKNQEIVAHIVSLIQNTKYDHVMSFVAESMETVEFMMAYIEGIKVE